MFGGWARHFQKLRYDTNYGGFSWRRIIVCEQSRLFHLSGFCHVVQCCAVQSAFTAAVLWKLKEENALLSTTCLETALP